VTPDRPSTQGIALRSGSRPWREAVELLSSMRFSISLLTLICIASVIGTVVKQNEPASNYVNQFGPFWSQLFTTAGLTQVYSASWFLLILAFLVLSTSLCIARNAPKIWADLRQYKENLREASLQSFHHRGQAVLPYDLETTYAHALDVLKGKGWRAKIQVRRDASGEVLGTMIAARKGATNKLGYICAHSAIVLICLGGLLDGDLVVRLQMWWQGKSSYAGEGLVRDVPAQHRLGPDTFAFRANINVPEGTQRGTALIDQAKGVVLQDLPFAIELEKFIVEYYPTGMPKLFASNIVIHDRDSGRTSKHTVKVNEPVLYRGINIYQSSFNDGGSSVKVQATPLFSSPEVLGEKMSLGQLTLEGRVGIDSSTPLKLPNVPALSIEFTELRPINVENMATQTRSQATDTAANTAFASNGTMADQLAALKTHLGSGANVKSDKELRNIGPSISYKLRDAAGQAYEFNNYMAPVNIEGQAVLLAGVRTRPDEPFNYMLHIPVDEQGSADNWVRLRQSLQSPALRQQAAQRYAQNSAPPGKPELAAQLSEFSSKALALFAGDATGLNTLAAGTLAEKQALASNGLGAIATYLETHTPPEQREQVSELWLRVLSSSLFELLNARRATEQLPPLVGSDDSTVRFMTAALLSLSESFYYPAPVLLSLLDFEQVQASVFQVTRTPGKKIVYLGCICLIIGVFAMLYIRERRLWIWLKPTALHSTQLSTALSTTRRTLDVDTEFEALKKLLLKQTPL
jgi:cytochrome c biogenesis protein